MPVAHLTGVQQRHYDGYTFSLSSGSTKYDKPREEGSKKKVCIVYCYGLWFVVSLLFDRQPDGQPRDWAAEPTSSDNERSSCRSSRG